MTPATGHDLDLGGRYVESTLITGCGRAEGRTIVVNLSPSALRVDVQPRTFLAPFTSTVLIDAVVHDAAPALLLRPRDDVGGIAAEPGWVRLGDALAGFPSGVPLWRGPQVDAGTVRFDPGPVLGNGSPASGPADFEVRLNLWYAPAGTDCVIHDEHPFVEIHTQVTGTGRMQKFRSADADSIYEDVVLPPGATHAPFGSWTDGGFAHPWHQYRADTDCLWLAAEYHPTDPERDGGPR